MSIDRAWPHRRSLWSCSPHAITPSYVLLKVYIYVHKRKLYGYKNFHRMLTDTILLPLGFVPLENRKRMPLGVEYPFVQG